MQGLPAPHSCHAHTQLLAGVELPDEDDAALRFSLPPGAPAWQRWLARVLQVCVRAQALGVAPSLARRRDPPPWKQRLARSRTITPSPFSQERCQAPELLLVWLFTVGPGRLLALAVFLAGCKLASRWDLGPIYVLLAIITVIFTSLGRKREGEASACECVEAVLGHMLCMHRACCAHHQRHTPIATTTTIDRLGVQPGRGAAAGAAGRRRAGRADSARADVMREGSFLLAATWRCANDDQRHPPQPHSPQPSAPASLFLVGTPTAPSLHTARCAPDLR
jgi:hypothetical protein